MADAALAFLLDNVTKLLASHLNLIADAEDELKGLKDDLKLLKAFLDQAAKVENKEEQFRELERQIREVVYDAEDTIDSCLTQAAAPKKKVKNLIPGILNPKEINLAKKVNTIREKNVKPMFDRARMNFANLKIGDGSGKSVDDQRARVMKASTIREENVVGLNDEEEKLLEYIMATDKDELDVISIIGMPGLGKTTLAWKIYQSQTVRFEFPTRIWVYVSQEFNLRDVFLNILKKSTSNVDMYSSLNDVELAHEVRQFLQKTKFFLVMDDVWTIEAWNAISGVLPSSKNESKVLITSRQWDVGKHANRRREPHNLRFLTEDESWELLQYEVFGKLNSCPHELEGIGKYIAKQCDGLPLAIVVIGGILVNHLPPPEDDDIETTLNEWQKVADNVSMHVQDNMHHNINISEIVAWSYNKLPIDLRDCFLYLAVFPEDYEIPTWTLTRLWIAEGFVRRKQGQILEKTAEENLKDLINRNLVMVQKINSNGQVKSCRVHDVIRAFCISKAEEQNLFQEIKRVNNETFYPLPSDIKNYRRLCIHSYLSTFLDAEAKGPGVRSFLCFNKEPNYCLEDNYLTAIPDAFSLLRVLESKSVKLTQFPLKITRLIHLRYITLHCDNLEYLPEAISSLWNLQTLIVDTKSHALKIEANIWKLLQLRHLKTKAAIGLVKQEECKATEGDLQTLSRLAPEYCTDDVFRRAQNLKTLGIRGQLATLVEARSLARLVHLEKLKLVYDLVYKPPSENQLHGLPQVDYFPPNLRRLTLSATYLDWKHMSTLGKINTLRVLKLKDNAFYGKSWNTADGSNFNSLQFLLIETAANLVFWDASTDHFPSLKRLVLKNCEQLNTIPLHLAKSLQILEVDGVTKSAVECAKKIKEGVDLKQGLQKDGRGALKLTIGLGCR